MTVKQRLGAQSQKPTGVLGWAAAGLMLVVGPSDCHHQAVDRLLDLQPDDALLDIACGSGLFLRRRAAHVRRVAGLARRDRWLAATIGVLASQHGGG